MANLPDSRWKNETGLDLHTAAKHLLVQSQKGQMEIMMIKSHMLEATGEVKEAYKLVLHDICWKMTQELFRYEKSMIGYITDMEYPPEVEASIPIDPFKTSPSPVGPTGSAVEQMDTRGANGPCGPSNDERYF